MKLSVSESTLKITALLLVLIGLFTGLDILELRAEEPRRALVALEMWLSGDWIVPTLHGLEYYNKPPVFNWVLVVFYQIFGSADEWVVRLPGLLSFLVTGWLIFSFLKKRMDANWSFLTMLAYWTSVDLFFYGAVNTGEIDLFFSLLVFAQTIWLLTFFEKQSKLTLFAGFYLLGALAFLTKGLPAILFTGLSVVGWLVWKREWLLLFSWQHLLGICVGCIPVAAFAWAYSQNTDIAPLLVALLKDATRKSAVESSMGDIILHLFVFPLEIAKLLLPWSLLIFFAFSGKVKSKLVSLPPHSLFLIIFIVVNIWVYWLSPDTRNRYIYPFLPAFIMLLSWIGYQVFRNRLRIGLWIVIILAGARLVYNFVGMPYQQNYSDNLIYRDHSANILQTTEGQPVYLLGEAFCEVQDGNPLASYFGIDSLCNPPLIPFQIPYYLTRDTRKMMKYKKKPINGEYYLCEKGYAQQYRPAILYEFRENWIENDLVLFKYKD